MSGCNYKVSFFRRKLSRKQKGQRGRKMRNLRRFRIFRPLYSFCSLLLFMAGLIMSVDSARMNPSLPGSLTESLQLILVTTTGWNTVDGEMKRYERDSINDNWKMVGEKTPIVVGRNGMAWGKG